MKSQPMLMRSLLLGSVALASTACDDKAVDTTTAEAKQAQANATPNVAANAGAASDTAKVEVDAEGTKFDPAIGKDRLPDGVWYCDMKTVHYASQAEGDGKCPYCGMKLKKFDAAAYAKQAAEHGHAHGNHGHEHGDDDHEHGDHGEGADHGHAH